MAQGKHEHNWELALFEKPARGGIAFVYFICQGCNHYKIEEYREDMG